ncbi:hypothetical protein ACJX0J_040817, partial [Zea mays]
CFAQELFLERAWEPFFRKNSWQGLMHIGRLKLMQICLLSFITPHEVIGLKKFRKSLTCLEFKPI